MDAVRRWLAAGLLILVVSGQRAPLALAEQRFGSSAQQNPVSGSVPAARLERLEQWLKALDRHIPGEEDDALAVVAAWSNNDLRGLWVDANALIQLMRNRTLTRISVQSAGQRGTTQILYSTAQLKRIAALSCAAAGILLQPECVLIKAGEAVDSDLLQLSAHASAAKIAGDEHYILRRGALLHADVEMLAPPPMVPTVTTPDAQPSFPPPGYRRSGVTPATAQSPGPESVRVNVSDGVETDLGQKAIHWELARMLLDHVNGHDGMVRQWYRATAAWMQRQENHDTWHLDHAREMFPTDPDILFLSGCQHETYARPAIQSAVKSAVLPAGFSLDVGSDRAELRQAEEFFHRALIARPDFAEAHLHLGHVLLRRGHAAEAALELQLAIASIVDEQLLYYAELFAGAAQEGTGQFDAARASYGKAAELYPVAQSPLLALSQLARRRGDRAGALRPIERLFALPPEAIEREDPWWAYHLAQARNAEALLEELRKPFLNAEAR